MDPHSARIVSSLRAARTALTWSQQDLADRSGVSKVTIARMESGKMSPRLATVAKLKNTLERSGARIVDQSPPGGFTLIVEGDALRTGVVARQGNPD